MSVTLGSSRLLASGRLRGRRVGILANPASIDGDFTHIVDQLRRAPDVHLAAIFGPQHGFRSDVQDNMIESAHGELAVGSASRSRLPLFSLYSDTREPTREMLDLIDVLVVDLQDIGARIYTYIYTMANCLRACARQGIDVIVCDRPNPIGGVQVEGAALRQGFESFVGQFPIPMRHGLTIGELAQLFNEQFGLGAALEVVAMEGWSRGMYADDTGLPWIMTSPNIPTLDTAVVYPGAVLVEGTNLSEGRGTTRPFELIGAPWLDAEGLAGTMNAQQLPGVHFRPVNFEPTFQKHARQPCGGCQIHVLDRRSFRPVRAAISLMRAIRAAVPERFVWREPPYEYEHRLSPMDILAGSSLVREGIDSGATADEITREWAGDEDAFRELRRPFLLYA